MNELFEGTARSRLVFQLLTLPVVGLFFLRSLRTVLRRDRHRWTALLGAVTWLGAGVAILLPGITNRLAAALGIGRGADLVIYGVAIAFLASFFYFYRKTHRLESDLTEVVRGLAIREALEREEPRRD